MPTKTKPPVKLRRVVADDLAIEMDSETYYPHAGESVVFKGRATVGLYVMIAQLGSSPEGLSLLAEQIDSWTWTDDEGKPYPEPTLDALLRLPTEELGWLIQNVSSDGEDVSKNADTPSIAT